MYQMSDEIYSKKNACFIVEKRFLISNLSLYLEKLEQIRTN